MVRVPRVDQRDYVMSSHVVTPPKYVIRRRSVGRDDIDDECHGTVDLRRLCSYRPMNNHVTETSEEYFA